MSGVFAVEDISQDESPPPRTVSNGVVAYGAHGHGAPNSSSPFDSPRRQSTVPRANAGGPRNAGGAPLCNCRLPCTLKSTESEENYGRQYWTCASRGSTCGFFKWEDPAPQALIADLSPVKPYAGGYEINDPRDVVEIERDGPGSFPENDSAGGTLDEQQGSGFKCLCGLPAATRISKSEANPGREYYTCPNNADARCKGFIKWVDEANDQPLDRPAAIKRQWTDDSEAAKRPRFEQLAPDSQGGGAQVMCKCPMECVLRTAATAKNNGRQFYTCPKPRDQQCGFFNWADELDKVDAGTGSDKKPWSMSAALSRGGNGGFSGARGGGSSFGGGGGRGGGGSSQNCYKCNQPGHWAKDCPNNSDSSYGTKFGSGRGGGGGGGRFGGGRGGGNYGRSPYGQRY